MLLSKKKRRKKKLLKSIKTNSIAIISLVISILTLGLGYIAYMKFLVQKAESHQMDLVLEFIDDLHSDEIPIGIYHKSPGFFGQHNEKIGNVFSYGNYGKYYTGYELYIDGNMGWKMKSDKYLFSPLLPNEIADSYRKFRMDNTYSNESIQNLSEVYLLGIPYDSLYEISDKKRDFGLIGLRKYNDGMRGFTKNAFSLKQSIISYFNERGIINLNKILLDSSQILFPHHESKRDRIKIKCHYTDEEVDFVIQEAKKIKKKYDSISEIELDTLKISEFYSENFNEFNKNGGCPSAISIMFSAN